MADIPESFMQPLEDQPNLSVDVEFDAKEIPVFDISSINVNLISEIREACKIWGFFQVINHGVDKKLRQKLETVAHNFFQEPLEQKKLIKRDELNPTGFHDSEHTQNVRDWKEVFICFTQDPTEVSASHLLEEVGIRNLSNRWPQHPSSFRETCEEYGKAVSALALGLLHMISLSLGLPVERLDDYFQNQGSYLLVNNYPTCPNPKLTLGVGPHKDPNAFTILAQDEVGGLEVKRKSDGSWIPVQPIPEAFIINIGDCMQVRTNDIYKSVEHRVVVNSTKSRMSIPLFFFPAHTTLVKPLEELVDEKNPARYKGFNWGKFMANRNRSDFEKQEGGIISISDFKIV